MVLNMHIPVNQILCGMVVKQGRLSKLVKQGAQRHHEGWILWAKVTFAVHGCWNKKHLNDDNLIT